MTVARPVTLAARRWLGLVAALVLGTFLLAVAFAPTVERGLIESGIVYTIVTYDQALPLFGLGIAFAPMTTRQTGFGIAVFAAGVLLGLLIEHRFMPALLDALGSTEGFAFIGPLSCVIAGFALATAGRLRVWVMPIAAALSGAAFGFLVAFHDPSMGGWRFAAGAAALALWLVAAPHAVLRQLNLAWLRIGGRVLASWLVAIGLMLGASKTLGKKEIDAPLVAPAAPPAPLVPGEPEIPDAPAPEPSPLRYDESRQP